VAAVATTPAASQAPSQAPAPSGAYKVGDRVKLGDEEYFAVTQVDPAVKATGAFKPAAGKKWVAALIQIEGINPDGATYNPFYFKARDGDGFEYNFSAFGKEPKLQSGNDLKPGAKVQGWVTFEVPAETKSLTLVYAAGFFADAVEVTLI
jgi:hypothetical protein